MSVTLYTQPNCPFCDLMKEMLDQTGFTYVTINIKENEEALQFMKDRQHRTVPQLYYNKIHINTRPNTQSYTSRELYSSIAAAMDGKWPGEDGGVEYGV